MSVVPMKAIARWLRQPAEWWQFWMPQSGAPGGIIAGLVLSATLFIGLAL